MSMAAFSRVVAHFHTSSQPLIWNSSKETLLLGWVIFPFTSHSLFWKLKTPNVLVISLVCRIFFWPRMHSAKQQKKVSIIQDELRTQCLLEGLVSPFLCSRTEVCNQMLQSHMCLYIVVQENKVFHLKNCKVKSKELVNKKVTQPLFKLLHKQLKNCMHTPRSSWLQYP